MKRAVMWMMVATFVVGLAGVYAADEGEHQHKGDHKRKGPGGQGHLRENKKEMLEKFDTDGNGELCESELGEAKKAWKAKHEEMRAKMLEKFDLDEDGKLNETERKAAREEMHKKRKAEKEDGPEV